MLKNTIPTIPQDAATMIGSQRAVSGVRSEPRLLDWSWMDVKVAITDENYATNWRVAHGLADTPQEVYPMLIKYPYPSPWANVAFVSTYHPVSDKTYSYFRVGFAIVSFPTLAPVLFYVTVRVISRLWDAPTKRGIFMSPGPESHPVPL